MLSPRLVSSEREGLVRVALVATSALLLPGDRVQVRVEVSGDVVVDLLDVAGTVAYANHADRRRRDPAHWDVEVLVGDGSGFCWGGEPLVVTQAADVHWRLSLHLAGPRSRTLVRDTLGLGRHGERPGALHAQTRVSDDAGPLLVEDLDLDERTLGLPGYFGGRRVVDTAFAFGWLPTYAPDGATVMHPARGGALTRSLTAAAHESCVASTFAHWRHEFLGL